MATRWGSFIRDSRSGLTRLRYPDSVACGPSLDNWPEFTARSADLPREPNTRKFGEPSPATPTWNNMPIDWTWPPAESAPSTRWVWATWVGDPGLEVPRRRQKNRETARATSLCRLMYRVIPTRLSGPAYT